MISVLYPANAIDFNSFGLGVLTDTVSCEVTEKRNGVFECLLKYPVSGQHYGLIAKSKKSKSRIRKITSVVLSSGSNLLHALNALYA